jgi:hypothetical protein
MGQYSCIDIRGRSEPTVPHEIAAVRITVPGMTRASKQTIVADSARIASTAIRRASGLLEQSDEREPQ